MAENVDPMSERQARDHVETVVKRSKTSFFWAMRALPEAKRHGMYAVYAFCREVDDIADERGTFAGKLVRLDEWRREIARVYDDQPLHPVSRALAGPIAEFGLGKTDFLTVIDGMEMDAGDRLRIADMGELSLYCDRVASAVGRLSVRIFGEPGESGRRVAQSLGQAMQMTNILRDLHEDAGRDRLYLPGELLRVHGIPDGKVDRILAHPSLPAACEELADIAGQRFDETERALKSCDHRRIRPAIVMKEVYRQVLKRMVARGWQRLDVRVTLSKAEKLWIAFRHGMM
jgi:squalene synthase HpnD